MSKRILYVEWAAWFRGGGDYLLCQECREELQKLGHLEGAKFTLWTWQDEACHWCRRGGHGEEEG
jgi:hypothetical protein